MNRFDCSGSSGLGAGLRGMREAYTREPHSSNRNDSCRGSGGEEALRRRSEGRRGFDFPLATSRSIGEPLALDTDEGDVRTGQIVDTEPAAVVESEVELTPVAMQMRFADAEIAPLDPAL